ncbi:hypothetical protein ABGB18_22760 [Nonomuraea sp. B12E4]|uniref:hypothetical protein n=1 Tax=Nonomuraea sp. B12E4 TaxID=3153564 RepID=UPI00325DA586
MLLFAPGDDPRPAGGLLIARHPGLGPYRLVMAAPPVRVAAGAARLAAPAAHPSQKTRRGRRSRLI